MCFWLIFSTTFLGHRFVLVFTFVFNTFRFDYSIKHCSLSIHLSAPLTPHSFGNHTDSPISKFDQISVVNEETSGEFYWGMSRSRRAFMTFGPDQLLLSRIWLKLTSCFVESATGIPSRINQFGWRPWFGFWRCSFDLRFNQAAPIEPCWACNQTRNCLCL